MKDLKQALGEIFLSLVMYAGVIVGCLLISIVVILEAVVDAAQWIYRSWRS